MGRRKLIILTIAIIFATGIILRSDRTFAANGNNCTSNGGKCTGGGKCGSNEESIGSDCDSSELCCKSKSSSSSGSGTNETSKFDNPLGSSDIKTVLLTVLSKIREIVAYVALVFIVIGAIMYMTSAGNEKRITTAKNTLTFALIGFAIAAAAPTFLKEILTILGGGSGITDSSSISSALTVKDIAINILNLLLSIVGILAIIAMVIGGGLYLTAYGDEDRMKAGKKTATWAIIGIAIALGSLTIIKQIASLLGYS